MAQQQQPGQDDAFVIDMGLEDPELGEGWDGKSSGPDLGIYDFEVIASAIKPGTSGKSAQLELQLQVTTEGKMLGRTTRAWYNTGGKDAEALGIARRRMANLVDACGLPRGQLAPEAFMGARFTAEVSERTYPKSDGKGGTITKTIKQIVGETKLVSGAPVTAVTKPAVVRPASARPGVNGPAARPTR